MIGIGVKISLAGSTSSFDADASAFFARVTAAGGTLSATEQTATNQLVIDMKTNGIWSSMKAIYPMVGASAAACAQNLKSSSFTGTFSSGWTFASTGATPNGTSAFMDSTLIPSTSLASNNFSCGYYSNLNIASTSSNTGEIGIFQSAFQMIGVSLRRSLNSDNFIADGYGQSILISGNANSDFFGIESRTSTTSLKLWKNNVLSGTNTSTDLGIRPTISITIGKMNGLTGFSNRRCAFAYVSDGLTDTEVGNFYTNVQTFNQTLNRQVGAQIVSDADAQAYINRVYTAGGTLTNTEANAVNQLTIDMKAAGIWTAMKAVYPMVGASAAACAQNLKSSSFTGTFSSGWTFASTGVTPNGTSAYMDTGLNPSLQTNFISNNHQSFYSRTQTPSGGNMWNIGVGYAPTGSPLFGLAVVRSGNNAIYDSGYYLTARITSTQTDGRAFWLGTCNASNSRKFVKNGSVIATNTATDIIAASNGNIAIGGLYDTSTSSVNYFSTQQCAFSSIGDSLTDAQASAFYTNVQNFNTTLSRQV